jgi:hypothetical protein
MGTGETRRGAQTASTSSGQPNSGALEDRGDALAATDAHRHQRVPTTGAVQFIDRFRRDDRTRIASDRTASTTTATTSFGASR